MLCSYESDRLIQRTNYKTTTYVYRTVLTLCPFRWMTYDVRLSRRKFADPFFLAMNEFNLGLHLTKKETKNEAQPYLPW